MVFTGPFEYTQPNRAAIRAMADILQDRLREVMREELGGTYGVSVSPGYEKFPREEYEVEIQFGSDPSRVEELAKVLVAQIEKFQTEGPTDKQVADVRETMLRDLQTSSKTNGFLLTNIAARYETGEDLATLFNLADYYNKLSPAVIQEAAKKYLNTDNYVLVELFPEKK
jgi:zinc protease